MNNTPIGFIPTKYLPAAQAATGMQWDGTSYTLQGELKSFEMRTKTQCIGVKSYSDGAGNRGYLIFPKHARMMYLKEQIGEYLEDFLGTDKFPVEKIWDIIFGRETTIDGKRLDVNTLKRIEKEADSLAISIRTKRFKSAGTKDSGIEDII